MWSCVLLSANLPPGASSCGTTIYHPPVLHMDPLHMSARKISALAEHPLTTSKGMTFYGNEFLPNHLLASENLVVLQKGTFVQ